ncbi:MAG TPA: 30S ribosomal protein S3 [Verrucomicrobiae bacterium]|nr:30S ribosomal protein S3 [Verrucomicrobiae bacterium]
MGHKVHPNGFRLGVYRNWQARWFATKREYTRLLHEDLAMRRLIMSRLRNASVARIETERSANQLTVIIHTAKPGIVIGRSGSSVDALRDNLERISGKKVRVTIQEIKSPEMDAQLVAESVAGQLEKRIAFRRAIKQSVMRSMRAGAKGVRIQLSGRLGGAEMSRREWDRDGRVPLHTLRADIDFGQTEAATTFGRIGVSVWLYRGDFTGADGGLPTGIEEPILEPRERRGSAATAPAVAAPAAVMETPVVQISGGEEAAEPMAAVAGELAAPVETAAVAVEPAPAAARPTRAARPRAGAGTPPAATRPARARRAPAAPADPAPGADAVDAAGQAGK